MTIKSIFSDINIPRSTLFDLILPKELDYNFQIALIDAVTNESLSFSQLRTSSLKLGYGLRKNFNLDKKDTVLIISPNSIHYPILFFGASSTGARVTLANPAYNHFELSHQLKDSGANYIFAHPGNLPLVKRILKDDLHWSDSDINLRVHTATPFKSDDVDPYTSLLSVQKQSNVPVKFDKEYNEHDVAVLCYSSGTTGLSKGVMSTHNNIVSNIIQINYSRLYPVDRHDVFMAILPFYHIFGFTVTLCYILQKNSKNILLPKFDLDKYAESIQKYKVTNMSLVPPILVLLANTDIDKKYDLSSLRVLQSGAAPLGEELINKLRNKFNHIIYIQGYGLTETSPVTHKLPVYRATTHSGYCGLLMPNTVARIVDENGNDVPGDNKSSGELWVKGPQIMKGYLNRPEATKESITSDGFFKTGDVAIYETETKLFKIVDRLKELIKYKGFQVPPASLEALLLSHPNVKDVAVIGIYDDEQATELPRAYIVKGSNNGLSDDQFCKSIEEWVAKRVANHSKLRGGVKLIDIIPKSLSGKIIRRQLKTIAAQDELKNAKSKL